MEWVEVTTLNMLNRQKGHSCLPGLALVVSYIKDKFTPKNML